MANVSSGIFFDANFMNLQKIPLPNVRKELFDLLVEGEQVEESFMTVRDQVVFTNMRIIVINVQGLTGKKISYLSYPYSKVQYFGVETAGVLDNDSELLLAFNDGNKLQFDFKTNVDIKKICASISKHVL